MSSVEKSKNTWREVPGTIVRSEVSFDWEYYSPEIEYRYEVDGVAYQGRKIVVGMLIKFNWRGPSRRLIERYPVGSTVTVYTDPKNPQRAYLQPRLDKNLPPFLIFFGAILALILFTVLHGRRIA